MEYRYKFIYRKDDRVRVIAIIAILMLLGIPGLVLAHGGHGGGGGEGASGGGGGTSGGGASSSGGGASSGEGSGGSDSGGMAPNIYQSGKAPQTRRAGTYFLTPQQVYTWDSFKLCATFGIVLERLNTDGSFSFTAGESTLNAQRMKDCMHKRGFRFP